MKKITWITIWLWFNYLFYCILFLWLTSIIFNVMMLHYLWIFKFISFLNLILTIIRDKFYIIIVWNFGQKIVLFFIQTFWILVMLSQNLLKFIRKYYLLILLKLLQSIVFTFGLLSLNSFFVWFQRIISILFNIIIFSNNLL